MIVECSGNNNGPYAGFELSGDGGTHAGGQVVRQEKLSR